MDHKRGCPERYYFLDTLFLLDIAFLTGNSGQFPGSLSAIDPLPVKRQNMLVFSFLRLYFDKFVTEKGWKQPNSLNTRALTW